MKQVGEAAAAGGRWGETVAGAWLRGPTALQAFLTRSLHLVSSPGFARLRLRSPPLASLCGGPQPALAASDRCQCALDYPAAAAEYCRLNNAAALPAGAAAEPPALPNNVQQN